MTTITIDTHKVVGILKAKGYSDEQAEGFVEAAREIDTSNLATRLYVSEKLNVQTWQLIGFMVAQAAFIIAMLQLT